MELDALWIWLAFAVSGATFLTHTFVGGPEAVKPLLASDLKTVPKYTNYYCWHLVTLTLLGMTACFLVAALWPGAWELAAAATLLAASFALWSILLNLLVRKHPLALPQWILFTPIAAFGILGII